MIDFTEVEPMSQATIAASQWSLVWRRLRRDRVAIASLAWLSVISCSAAGAGLIAKLVGHSPNETYLAQMTDSFGLPRGPNLHFWFGADTVGRDVFVRVIYGARTSLLVALISVVIAVVVGTFVGLVSGFFGGIIDMVASRLLDVVVALPVLLLALGLSSSCGLNAQGCAGGTIKPGLLLVSYIIGLFTWPYIARIVRSQVLSLRETEFVEAARSLGAGNARVIFEEILPNVVPTIVVYATLLIPTNILFEASLSFLGVGVPPTTPSWGSMISDASTVFTQAWWMMVFPGVFLFLTILASNLLGDSVLDALDPSRRS